jgi:hypothetical protein
MFEQAFKNIDDVLWKEAGCTTERDYAEQTSWLLFLKYLDGLEQDRADEAALHSKKYTYILDKSYRWESWASPKGKDGKLDHNASRKRPVVRTLSNTKSDKSLERLGTRFPAAITCVKLLITLMNCAFAPRARSTSYQYSTKKRSSVWATLGATAMGSKTDCAAFRRSRRERRVIRLAPRLQVRRDVDRRRHSWRFRGRRCSHRKGYGRSAQAPIAG